jgi:hypothetical protein
MLTRSLALALFGATALACGELPGEVVGTYRITMTLEENSCGAGAINLLDGHRYSVELRSDMKRGYWHVPGQPPLKGEYDAPNFRFENAGIVASEGPDAGPRGCSLRQVDRLTGRVSELPDAGSADQDAEAEGEQAADAEAEGEEEADAAADKDVKELDAGLHEDTDDDAGTDEDLALRGEHTFTISAASGSDCGNALEPRGPFQKLPCTVRYSVRGVAIRPF